MEKKNSKNIVKKFFGSKQNVKKIFYSTNCAVFFFNFKSFGIFFYEMIKRNQVLEVKKITRKFLIQEIKIQNNIFVM